MFMAIAFVLSIASAVYVALPLFRNSVDQSAQAETFDQLYELLYQKKLAEDTLKDLDFDLQTGKLSIKDHAALTADQNQVISRVDIQIAQKSSAKKSDGAKKAENDIATAVNTLRPMLTKFCEKCGSRTTKEARFCSQCGTAVK